MPREKAGSFGQVAEVGGVFAYKSLEPENVPNVPNSDTKNVPNVPNDEISEYIKIRNFRKRQL